MIIYNKIGAVLLDTKVSDDSHSYSAIKQIGSLNLYYSLPTFVEIPVGAYCIFQGVVYTLEKSENFVFKKLGSRNFEYTLILESPEAKSTKYIIRNPIDKRIKFPYTAKPIEHLQLIVDNLNMRDNGWSVGTCVDGIERQIVYNCTYCYDALQNLAESCNTEFEIVGKTIHLYKIEYNKASPLALSYGKGNGFKPGLGRGNMDSAKPLEILYVQGGDKNIDVSSYGSKELILPKSQTLIYEGRTYITDAEGFSVRRADRPQTSFEEGSFDCSHIYPSRVGTVSGVEVIDEEKNLYDFIDSSIPEDLDFSQYRIAGERITIIFQSGMLVGQEFVIEQNEDSVAGYVHSERRFKLVPQEEYGQTVPNALYCPVVGDKYIIFGISMPEAYVCNNATKSGASWDMFREAAKFLYENEDNRFSFTGVLDSIWAKKNWLAIGGKILVGGYINFSDNQFHPEGTLIRIVGIKRFVNKPYSPEIELSNTTVGGSVGREIEKIGDKEVIIDETYKKSVKFTKRSFNDVRETMDMLKEYFDDFSEGIDPIFVQTMSLLVGSASLQFRYVSSKTTPVAVMPDFVMNDETKVFSASAGIIQHLTLGIKSISSAHLPSEYRYWDVSSYVSPSFVDKSPMYLFLKCAKSGTAGEYLLSKTVYKMDQSEDFYYFLVGTLSSEKEGVRSFITLYGFTAIEGGNVTTNIIRSPDGQTYINLETGEIGGKMRFRAGSYGLTNLQEWDGVAHTIGAIGDNANYALNAANSANQNVSALSDYINGSFSDGIISEAEAKAIEKYINTINESKAVAEASFNKLYSNVNLTGSAKTNLLTAKNNLFSAINTLLGNISLAITDGKTTPEEKNVVDLSYTAYTNAMVAYTTAIETAKEFIQSAITSMYAYLKEAMQGTTEINGGLLLTSAMLLRGLDGVVRAGMSGVAGDNVLLFADPTGGYDKAKQGKSMFLLNRDGTANLGLLRVKKRESTIEDDEEVVICEKVYSGGVFVGYGNPIVRFIAKDIPPFTDLVTNINKSVSYYGGSQNLYSSQSGSFGYSGNLTVTEVDSFNLTVSGNLSITVVNNSPNPMSMVSLTLSLYQYIGGSYVFDRVIDTIAVMNDLEGTFNEAKSVSFNAILGKGTYVLSAEYEATFASLDSCSLSVSGVNMNGVGASANKCLIFGQNGFVRIKDGNNYTYISDNMVAMKGLPTSQGVVNSGQLYTDNKYVKVS